MRQHIILNSQIDFKIGLQLGEEKIVLRKPHDTHEVIESWVTNSVVTRPLLGFMYIDDGVKKVFQIQEDAKYSSETLTRFVTTVNELKGSQFVQTEPAQQILQAIHA